MQRGEGYGRCYSGHRFSSITRQGVQPAMVDRAGLNIYREEISSQFDKNIINIQSID